MRPPADAHPVPPDWTGEIREGTVHEHRIAGHVARDRLPVTDAGHFLNLTSGRDCRFRFSLSLSHRPRSAPPPQAASRLTTQPRPAAPPFATDRARSFDRSRETQAFVRVPHLSRAGRPIP